MRDNRFRVLDYLAVFLIAAAASICAAQEEPDQEPMPAEMQARWAVTDGPDDVYIRVSEQLDEWRYYCLDIPGNNDDFVGVQLNVHTCKEGMAHRDTIFSNDRTASGDIYMPDYDLCVEPVAQEAGSPIQLANCTGDLRQKWDFGSNNISPLVNSGLCLTVSSVGGELTSGGLAYPTGYMSREISLQSCNDEIADRQQWLKAKPMLDLKAPFLPDGSPADWRDWISPN